MKEFRSDFKFIEQVIKQPEIPPMISVKIRSRERDSSEEIFSSCG
jgi:hypothetical protein